MLRHQQRGHLRFFETQPHPVARDPWLLDFEKRLSDELAVSDANLVVCQAVHGEVLAEGPGFRSGRPSRSDQKR